MNMSKGVAIYHQYVDIIEENMIAPGHKDIRCIIR
jgi:hypothetical protein